MGESLVVQLEGASALAQHLDAVPLLDPADLGNSLVFPAYLGFEGGCARLRDTSHDLVVVAARQQGLEKFGIALDRLAGRRRERHERRLEHGADMRDCGELTDVADETVRDVDGCRGEISQRDRNSVTRLRIAIAADEESDLV